MAIPSAALAYRRSALMTATKVTTKPPTTEVLRARDNFKDFCVIMGKHQQSICWNGTMNFAQVKILNAY